MSLRTAFVPVLALVLASIGCQSKVVDESTGDDATDTAENESSVTQCETPVRACEPDASSGYEHAVQYCTLDEKGGEQWTACCGYEVADCECVPPWAGEDWSCNTPLVLSFEGGAVTYTTEMAGSFDLTGAGMSVAMDWPTAATPWLALDRDGNGSIDSGAELFGSATKLGSGKLAINGFLALEELDDNGDGVVDGNDAAFSKLVVWRDKDASRSSDASELTPASASIDSIDVRYSIAPRCDERGNCEVERASFHFKDASGQRRTGSVIDVHLKQR